MLAASHKLRQKKWLKLSPVIGTAKKALTSYASFASKAPKLNTCYMPHVLQQMWYLPWFSTLKRHLARSVRKPVNWSHRLRKKRPIHKKTSRHLKSSRNFPKNKPKKWKMRTMTLRCHRSQTYYQISHLPTRKTHLIWTVACRVDPSLHFPPAKRDSPRHFHALVSSAAKHHLLCH